MQYAKVGREEQVGQTQSGGDLSLLQNSSNTKWSVLETTSLERDIGYTRSNNKNNQAIFQNVHFWNTLHI